MFHFREILYDQRKELEILEQCTHLIPILHSAEIVDRKVGIRPWRDGGIRLEWSGM
jgi:hypothetical protein